MRWLHPRHRPLSFFALLANLFALIRGFRKSEHSNRLPRLQRLALLAFLFFRIKIFHPQRLILAARAVLPLKRFQFFYGNLPARISYLSISASCSGHAPSFISKHPDPAVESILSLPIAGPGWYEGQPSAFPAAAAASSDCALLAESAGCRTELALLIDLQRSLHMPLQNTACSYTLPEDAVCRPELTLLFDPVASSAVGFCGDDALIGPAAGKRRWRRRRRRHRRSGRLRRRSRLGRAGRRRGRRSAALLRARLVRSGLLLERLLLLCTRRLAHIANLCRDGLRLHLRIRSLDLPLT